ncbi:MAG: hypothetical protein JJU45_11840 [Acidimicrobiia bacterium]|nr:hypothetical protein [Acidimicrobiia bacterium]
MTAEPTADSSAGSTAGGVPSGRRSRRRVDPQGRQALFTAPVTAAPDQLTAGVRKDGRDALFSTGPRQPATVVVRCSACGSSARVGLLDLGVRLVSISAWLPGRRYGHWLRCPTCHTHAWCSIAFRD